MENEKNAVLVFPARYSLKIQGNGSDWGWCQFLEFIDAVESAARKVGTIQDLELENRSVFVSSFAALVKRHSISEPDKFFFSRNGTILEVVRLGEMENFKTEGIFVPEGWAQDVIKTILKGGVRVFYGRLESVNYPSIDVLQAVGKDRKFFDVSVLK